MFCEVNQPARALYGSAITKGACERETLLLSGPWNLRNEACVAN
jgi:hypothetical protein